MTKWIPAGFVVLVIAAAGSSGILHAQETETATPARSEQLELLASDAGVWDAQMTMWMGGPDAEPTVVDGVETNHLLTDQGMWLISEFQCEFGGLKFVGHGQFGYDPVKKKYVGTWIDNMSPHLTVMEGTFDKATKKMTMVSRGTHPETGKPMTGRNVTHHIDHDNKEFTMYGPSPTGEGEAKQFVIKYTRRKEK